METSNSDLRIEKWERFRFINLKELHNRRVISMSKNSWFQVINFNNQRNKIDINIKNKFLVEMIR